MISDKDMDKLLSLARIEVSAEEKEKLRKDVENILGYVSEVQKASVHLDTEAQAGRLRNVMREDIEPHESGAYTEQILKQAPSREDDYIVVKKIL
jgi:aspartyl/glutamyl-tRNA(Asn/Gln) amidotransferase C subunit